MCKFILACFIFLFWVSPIYAVDLTIADPIVSDLDITISASLSASSNYYLQGLLRSASSSKYFGETLGQHDIWVDYLSSPEKEYISSNFFLTDVQNASWSGKVKLRFKLDDANYLGPGAYDLKLRRYTGSSSSSAGESNTLSINLTTSLPLLSPSPSPLSTPTPTATPTPSPSVTPTTPAQSPKPSPIPLSSIAPQSPQVGTIAGAMAEIDLSGFGVSPTPSPILPGQSESSPSEQGGLTLNRSRLQLTLILGVGLIVLTLTGVFGLRRYRRLKADAEL